MKKVPQSRLKSVWFDDKKICSGGGMSFLPNALLSIPSGRQKNLVFVCTFLWTILILFALQILLGKLGRKYAGRRQRRLIMDFMDEGKM
jgi:hypothetical protein